MRNSSRREKEVEETFLKNPGDALWLFQPRLLQSKTGKERVKPPILEVGGISETYDSGL